MIQWFRSLGRMTSHDIGVEVWGATGPDCVVILDPATGRVGRIVYSDAELAALDAAIDAELAALEADMAADAAGGAA